MNETAFLIKKRRAVRVIYVSTYIPKKCGIATFTKDVTNAINMINPYALAEIMAVVEKKEKLEYPWETKFKIEKEDLNSYLLGAEYINQSDCDVVMIEHEFGIFGGQMGEYIVPFMETVKKPIVTTCHTIPDKKNGQMRNILERIIEASRAVTVMLEQSADKLVKDYGIKRNKIAVIPHGTPDLTFESTERMKKKKRLKDRLVLGNINLLSSVKGLEYSLEAVAEIRKKIPEVLLVVVGQTHPRTKKLEGEKYRRFLQKRVKELDIKKNVKFVNRYVSLDELIDWLKTIDFYITPYLDPDQSSSGALAYAVGAGKLCISTPYKYAKEVLGEGRGVLVPYRNSGAIARAVIELNKNKQMAKNMRKKAYEYGRFMTWHSVALAHLDLFRAVMNKKSKRRCGIR